MNDQLPFTARNPRATGKHQDQINISLNSRPDISEWITETADKVGISRADVVRQCIELVMAKIEGIDSSSSAHSAETDSIPAVPE